MGDLLDIQSWEKWSSSLAFLPTFLTKVDHIMVHHSIDRKLSKMNLFFDTQKKGKFSLPMGIEANIHFIDAIIVDYFEYLRYESLIYNETF